MCFTVVTLVFELFNAYLVCIKCFGSFILFVCVRPAWNHVVQIIKAFLFSYLEVSID